MYNDYLVIGVTPANQETNVSVSSVVEIQFSKAIDESTITPSTIYVQKISTGQMIASRLQYLPFEKKVIVTPDAPLDGSTKYRIVILGGKEGIASIDGNIMLETKYYDFTTEAVFSGGSDPEPDPEPSPGPEPNPGPVVTTVFEPVATYPKQGDTHIMPTTIKILFSDAIDASSVNHQSVYVLKKRKPQSLNIIDLLTEYSPNHSILNSANNPITLEQGNTVISIQLNDGDLEKNTEYLVVVRETIQNASKTASLGEVYFWSFMTTLSPLYGDIERVRSDIQSFATNISDSTIYKYMHEASIEARDIVTRRDASIDLTENIPHYVHQYVRAKAAYDLLVSVYTSTMNETGVTKVLGDLQIQRSSGTANISKVLQEFKDRIKPWLDELRGHTNRGYARPSTVVRGETGDPYPSHLTRTDFTGLEG